MKEHITLFQAPYAALMACGMFDKMHDPENHFSDTVPAQFYLVAFDGEIDCPDALLRDEKTRTDRILEYAFRIFNLHHPAGYCGRSMSVGDVVKLGDAYYLCAATEFIPVKFTATENSFLSTAPCAIRLPDGTSLRAKDFPHGEYPRLAIFMQSKNEPDTLLCFAEYNPERAQGHRLCIAAYCSAEEDTVYYESYEKIGESEA